MLVPSVLSPLCTITFRDLPHNRSRAPRRLLRAALLMTWNKSRRVTYLVKKFPEFYGAPCLKQPDLYLYLDPDESNPRHPIVLP
jgi:hypothetical protein